MHAVTVVLGFASDLGVSIYFRYSTLSSRLFELGTVYLCIYNINMVYTYILYFSIDTMI